MSKTFIRNFHNLTILLILNLRAKGPTKKETSSRSNSLSRAGSKPNITVAKRTKQDVLSQSVRTESKTRFPGSNKISGIFIIIF